MVLLVPLNALLAFKSRQYQMRLMSLKDARLKLMSDVLSGMKVWVDLLIHVVVVVEHIHSESLRNWGGRDEKRRGQLGVANYLMS